MTIHGSCLCGGIRFEFERAVGPFEICHCNRCRKLSGAQAMPAIAVATDGYRITAGRELIASFTAPILSAPPAYRSLFCSQCGSTAPDPDPTGDTVEIPAGLLDDDPGLTPDKHIFIECLPPWDKVTDNLPQLDIRALKRERDGTELPSDFTVRSHYDAR